MTNKLADLNTDKADLFDEGACSEVGSERGSEFDGVVAYAERLAHDANNYIGAILGLSEVLPSVADDPEQVNSIATRIAAAGQLLQIIVNQALLPMLGKFDAPSLHIEDAMERLRALSGHLVGRRIEFQMASSLADVSLAMTMGEFSTLIFILLRNAVDAVDMAEGARPFIHVSIDALSGEEIAADARRQNFVDGTLPKGRVLVLRVQDNGHGFSDVLRQNVASAFRPFVSQSRRPSALGLGLSFASTFVERRGGAMAIECGEETCVTAYLSVRENSDGNAIVAPVGEMSSRVIVVDPTAQWGAVTATLLGLLDWPVRQAGSVGEAAAMLEEGDGGRHVVMIRVPFRSLEAEAVAKLQAVISSRGQGDLVMMVGPVHAMAADEAAANVLSELATLVLPDNVTPADIVNYLIPNI